MEKQLLSELRTIKMLCIANFIEIQDIKRKLEIDGKTREDLYAYFNDRHEHLEILSKKLAALMKDDIPNLWENTLGPS